MVKTLKKYLGRVTTLEYGGATYRGVMDVDRREIPAGHPQNQYFFQSGSTKIPITERSVTIKTEGGLVVQLDKLPMSMRPHWSLD